MEQFVNLFPDDKIKQVVELYRRVQIIDLKNTTTEMVEKASLVKEHVEQFLMVYRTMHFLIAAHRDYTSIYGD